MRNKKYDIKRSFRKKKRIYTYTVVPKGILIIMKTKEFYKYYNFIEYDIVLNYNVMVVLYTEGGSDKIMKNV